MSVAQQGLDALHQVVADEAVEHVAYGFGQDDAGQIGVGLHARGHHRDMPHLEPAERKVHPHLAQVRQIEWVGQVRRRAPLCGQRCILEPAHQSRQEDRRSGRRRSGQRPHVAGPQPEDHGVARARVLEHGGQLLLRIAGSQPAGLGLQAGPGGRGRQRLRRRLADVASAEDLDDPAEAEALVIDPQLAGDQLAFQQ